ncbi:MAG: hypothetical protein KDD28_28250, partial [Phaeodactylibacter sp.]|nr:hypothetical protein [Phaeodactylibacter sp.]
MAGFFCEMAGTHYPRALKPQNAKLYISNVNVALRRQPHKSRPSRASFYILSFAVLRFFGSAVFGFSVLRFCGFAVFRFCGLRFFGFSVLRFKDTWF